MILLQDNGWFKANTSVSVFALISVFNQLNQFNQFGLAMCPTYSVQCVPKKRATSQIQIRVLTQTTLLS